MISDAEYATASDHLTTAKKTYPGREIPPLGQDGGHEAWVERWAGDAVSRFFLSFLDGFDCSLLAGHLSIIYFGTPKLRGGIRSRACADGARN